MNLSFDLLDAALLSDRYANTFSSIYVVMCIIDSNKKNFELGCILLNVSICEEGEGVVL